MSDGIADSPPLLQELERVAIDDSFGVEGFHQVRSRLITDWHFERDCRSLQQDFDGPKR